MTTTAHQEACRKYYAKNALKIMARQAERKTLKMEDDFAKVKAWELPDRLALAKIAKIIDDLGDRPAEAVGKIIGVLKDNGF
jgi:hypothetical protein